MMHIIYKKRLQKHIHGISKPFATIAILFAAWDGKIFLLLHQFVKKTQKTPPREIKQAKRELADWKERGEENE